MLAASVVLAASGALADTTVLVNVNVIPMYTDTVLLQQTVIIVDGKISEVGHVDAISIPKNAALIDGTERFLMPGLAEMHAHVTSTEYAEVDRLGTLFVANGITTIRGMLGKAEHLVLRDQLESGEAFGPRLITSGPSLNGGSVAGAMDADRQVREQHAAGYDFIKVHPGLSNDEFVALAAAANEIGIPFAGHVPVSAGVFQALKSDMATIDHLDGYFAAMLPSTNHGSGGYGGFFDVMLAADIDIEKIAEIVAMTGASGTWNVPTQVLVEQMIDDISLTELKQRPEARYVPTKILQRWVTLKESLLNERGFDLDTAALAIKLRRRLIFELHEAGAGLLLGSDAPQAFNVPGFSTHRELTALVAAGLTPYEALRTGTVEVANFLDSNGGVIAKGKDADLVLLDSNPLENIKNSNRIHGVMLRGKWLPSSELDARLERYAIRDGK